MIQVEPASLTQVIRGRGGRLVYVDDDVCNVAKTLRAVDPSLRLAYNEVGEYYVVYQTLADGSEHLVTTAQELDQRLVHRVAEVCSPGYDAGRELDLLHDVADAEHERHFHQRTGEVGERLAHAIRSDLNIKRNF